MQRENANDARTSTAQSVASRLDFMMLTERQCDGIRSLKPIVERELPNALAKFYKRMQAEPQVARFFSSDDQVKRAGRSQIDHWQNISSGRFDQTYAGSVKAIGKVHARIGLAPQWYIGGYAIIIEHLVTAAITETFTKGGLFSRPAMAPDEFAAALSGLIKAALLDMDLAISVYIDEAEAEKQRLQQEAIDSERHLVFSSFGAALASVADKDLTCHVDCPLPPAYESLRDDFNQIGRAHV
jgi:methyl-accepting chemotaxis protein